MEKNNQMIDKENNSWGTGGQQTSANALSYHRYWLQCIVVINQYSFCGFIVWPPLLATSITPVSLMPSASSLSLASSFYAFLLLQVILEFIEFLSTAPTVYRPLNLIILKFSWRKSWRILAFQYDLTMCFQIPRLCCKLSELSICNLTTKPHSCVLQMQLEENICQAR